MVYLFNKVTDYGIVEIVDVNPLNTLKRAQTKSCQLENNYNLDATFLKCNHNSELNLSHTKVDAVTAATFSYKRQSGAQLTKFLIAYELMIKELKFTVITISSACRWHICDIMVPYT